MHFPIKIKEKRMPAQRLKKRLKNSSFNCANPRLLSILGYILQKAEMTDKIIAEMKLLQKMKAVCTDVLFPLEIIND